MGSRGVIEGGVRIEIHIEGGVGEFPEARVLYVRVAFPPPWEQEKRL